MSLASRTPDSLPRTNEPSVHATRARQLLLGGLLGGALATAVCLVAFAIAYGVRGLASAGLAAAMVLFFYCAGQYVMVLFADAGARLLLAVALASYTTRVAVLGLVLLIFDRHTDDWPALVPMAVFVTTIAVVAGWLIVEVIVFSRLRISVYDTPYEPPSSASAPAPVEPASGAESRS